MWILETSRLLLGCRPFAMHSLDDDFKILFTIDNRPFFIHKLITEHIIIIVRHTVWRHDVITIRDFIVIIFYNLFYVCCHVAIVQTPKYYNAVHWRLALAIGYRYFVRFHNSLSRIFMQKKKNYATRILGNDFYNIKLYSNIITIIFYCVDYI